jgi:hypothetical protein
VRFEGTDIEGYLAHHHDMIMLSTADNAKRGAEEDAQEMQVRSVCSTSVQCMVAGSLCFSV